MRKIDPERYAARRQEIIEAAEVCFRRDGYRGASMSSICAQAGMSPGHLYHYFKSKDEIVRAHMGAMLEETIFSMEQGFPAFQGPFVERLADWLCEILRRMLANPNRQAMVLEIAAEAGRNPEVAGILRERIGVMLTKVTVLIRKEQDRGSVNPSVDAAYLVLTIRSLIRGMLTPPTNDPQIFPEEEKYRMLRQVVLALCSPKGGTD